MIYLSLADSIIKLVNTLLEGTPVNLRKIQALTMWGIIRPIVVPMIKDESIKTAIIKLEDALKD